MIEVWRLRAWTKPFVSFGGNPLLPYLLNFAVHPLLIVLHLEFLANRFDSGLAGWIRVIIYSGIVLGLSAWLTHRRLVRIAL